MAISSIGMIIFIGPHFIDEFRKLQVHGLSIEGLGGFTTFAIVWGFFVQIPLMLMIILSWPFDASQNLYELVLYIGLTQIGTIFVDLVSGDKEDIQVT